MSGNRSFAHSMFGFFPRMGRFVGAAIALAGTLALFQLATPAHAAPLVPVDVCVLDSGSVPVAGVPVEYRSGSWVALGETAANGCVSANIEQGNVNFRVNVAGLSATKKQNLGVDPVVVFQTVAATVAVSDSAAVPIEGAVAEYKAGGGWQPIGATGPDGTAAIELLPKTIDFRVSLGGLSVTKKQNVGADPVVAFQTVSATVAVTDSAGNPIEGAVAEYKGGGWQPIGSTGPDGSATIELLPKTIDFRVSLAGVTVTKKQNVGLESVVVFQTVAATVVVRDSASNPVAGAVAAYRAGAWQPIGSTGPDGTVAVELLPKTVQFRVTLGGLNVTAKQEIGADPVVVFQTVATTVLVRDSGGNAVAGATVDYKAGNWRSLGTTGVEGTVLAEMLAGSVTFRAKAAGLTSSLKQNAGIDPFVVLDLALAPAADEEEAVDESASEDANEDEPPVGEEPPTVSNDDEPLPVPEPAEDDGAEPAAAAEPADGDAVGEMPQDPSFEPPLADDPGETTETPSSPEPDEPDASRPDETESRESTPADDVGNEDGAEDAGDSGTEGVLGEQDERPEPPLPPGTGRGLASLSGGTTADAALLFLVAFALASGGLAMRTLSRTR